MIVEALEAKPEKVLKVYDQAIEMVLLSRKDINSISSKVSDGVNCGSIITSCELPDLKESLLI